MYILLTDGAQVADTSDDPDLLVVEDSELVNQNTGVTAEEEQLAAVDGPVHNITNNTTCKASDSIDNDTIGENSLNDNDYYDDDFGDDSDGDDGDGGGEGYSVSARKQSNKRITMIHLLEMLVDEADMIVLCRGMVCQAVTLHINARARAAAKDGHLKDMKLG